MQHDEAVRNMTVERYLLGELTADQKEKFEDHFFGCPECASDVRLGAMLVDNARTELRAQPNNIVTMPAAAPLWKRALPIAAAAAFACITAYQSLVVIPGLQRGSELTTLASISLQSAASRDGAIPEFVVEPGKPLGLYIDIPSAAAGETYTCTITDQAGKQRLATTVTGEQAKNTVHLLAPAGKLDAGEYDLRVSAPGGSEVVRYRFRLRGRA